MTTITDISSREILNSKGNPTIETMVTLRNGITSIASVPSGTSVSSFEAIEIEPQHAIKNIAAIIAPALRGQDVTNQEKIDTTMLSLDKTPNKATLGGNAILSVSIAVAKAAASSRQVPVYRYIQQLVNHSEKIVIPTPLFNLINGGQHASGSLDFQEFMIIPNKTMSFSESLRAGTTIYASLKKRLQKEKLSTLVGDEGGFGLSGKTNTEALTLLMEEVIEANYQAGKQIFCGIDAAATSFYTDATYAVENNTLTYSPRELLSYYERLQKQFPLIYLEDPVMESDWENWTHAVETLSPTSLVVGDDLISTNLARLHTAIEKKAVTGIIIKPNQIGTITETLSVVKAAKEAGLTIIVSHRSGETNDDFIADFGVGVGADYVKFGAPVRGERVAKYNRLRMIEEEIRTEYL